MFPCTKSNTDTPACHCPAGCIVKINKFLEENYYIGPEPCKCNSEGVQKDADDGDWCWLAEGQEKIICRLANGKITPDWTWARCVHEGSVQLDCTE